MLVQNSKLLNIVILWALLINMVGIINHHGYDLTEKQIASNISRDETLLAHPLEVYTDTYWGGSLCYSDAPQSANVHYTCDNGISSIYLDPGWSVRVYSDQNQQGSSTCINHTERDLVPGTYFDGGFLNDTISSFTLYDQPWCGDSPIPAWPFEVYLDLDFTNSRCYSWAAGPDEIFTDCNEGVTSILLRPGWSVILYKDAGQQGPSACLSTSDSDLRDNNFSDGSMMSDAITSFNLLNSSPCDSTPPSGNLETPTDGSIIGMGTVRLVGLAWDEPGGSGINRVEFNIKYDGTWHQVGTSYSAPYEVNWIIPSTLTSQDIQVGLQIVDNAGNISLNPGGVTTLHFVKSLSDITPPGGNITQPADGITINEPHTIYIAANAWDNAGGSGVNRVEFWVKYNGRWNNIKNDSSYPYSVSWTMPDDLGPQDIEIGTHIVDNAGNMQIDPGGKRTIHYVSADTKQPGGTLLFPLNGTKVAPGSSVYVHSLAWDNFGGSGVNRVEFWAKYDNEWHNIKTDYTSPYTTIFVVPSNLGSQDIEIGTHIVDNAGNMAIDSGGKRVVHCKAPVDITPPTGSITSPLNDATFLDSATIRISADARDNYGGSGVNRVEFWVKYNNEWHVAGNYDYTPPYYVDWAVPSNLGAQVIEIGTHIVDNSGNMAIDSGGKIAIHYGRSQVSIPYIHQLWSTGDSFVGYYACGSSSLGMLLAWYDKLQPRDPWGATGFQSFWSPYSWYVINDFGNLTDKEWDASPWCTGTYGGLYGSSNYYSYYANPVCGNYLAGWDQMSTIADNLGANNYWYASTNKNQLISLVQSGKPVLLGTGLCGLGHIVLVIGYDAATDKFIVSDPYGQCVSGSYNIYAHADQTRYGWEQLNAGFHFEQNNPIPGWTPGQSLIEAYNSNHSLIEVKYPELTALPPTPLDGSLVPSDNQYYINQPLASFTFRFTDSDLEITDMRFSNDGSNWEDWVSFNYEFVREFTLEEGLKYVYAEIKDVSGNVATFSTSVVLDTTAPIGSISLVETDVDKESFYYRVSVNDPAETLDKMIVSQDATFKNAQWVPYVGETIIGSLEKGNVTYARLMDKAGNISDTLSLTVETPDFIASSRCGTELLQISFVDNSFGDITSWEWDFGDGSSSTEQNPIHTYINYGDTQSYSVTLTITTESGSWSLERPAYIYVTDESGVCNTGSITIRNHGANVDFDGDFEAFTLQNGQSITFDELPIGNYSVVEVVNPNPSETLTLEDVMCTTINGNLINVYITRYNNKVVIPLGFNENLLCTFSNKLLHNLFLPLIIKN